MYAICGFVSDDPKATPILIAIGITTATKTKTKIKIETTIHHTDHFNQL